MLLLQMLQETWKMKAWISREIGCYTAFLSQRPAIFWLSHQKTVEATLWARARLRKVKMKVKSLSRARLFATPWTVACTKLHHPWDFPGKSTGVGCHFLQKGIFPPRDRTQVFRIVYRRFTIWATRLYLIGLVFFPTFFNLNLNLAIRGLWSEPQSAPGLVFVDCIALFHLWLQRI